MGWFGLDRKVTYNAWLQDTYVVQIIQQPTYGEFFSLISDGNGQNPSIAGITYIVALIFIISFCLWIWLEISAFVEIGGEIGVLLTLIGIFVTGAIGLWLLRTQGRAVMASLQRQVARGEAPLASVADSLSLLLGAVLMLIPGYVSDAIGLVMFVPGIRTLVGAVLLKRIGSSRRFSFMGGSSMGAKSGFTSQDFMAGGFDPDGFPKRGFDQTDRHHGDESDTIEGEFEDRGETAAGSHRALDEK